MKRPTFFQGVLVAGGLALLASAVVAAFVPFVGTLTVARLVIPGLALVYILYLLSRSAERTGRITVITLWSVVTVLAWWFVPSFSMYLLIHIGAIWLTRSLYFYAGLFPALMDLGLNGLSATVAFGTLIRTGSVFLATWSFFLTQALFVAIPASLRPRKAAETSVDNDAFERSRRHAEAALRQLITE